MVAGIAVAVENCSLELPPSVLSFQPKVEISLIPFTAYNTETESLSLYYKLSFMIFVKNAQKFGPTM